VAASVEASVGISVEASVSFAAAGSVAAASEGSFSARTVCVTGENRLSAITSASKNPAIRFMVGKLLSKDDFAPLYQLSRLKARPFFEKIT
jgi:hypothetical protein